MAVFGVFYLQSFFALAQGATHLEVDGYSGFFYFFTPQIIIAGVVAVVANLIYRILGIWYIVKKTTLTDAEKIAWVLGFVCFGFVTAIVFLLISKNRNFIDN